MITRKRSVVVEAVALALLLLLALAAGAQSQTQKQEPAPPKESDDKDQINPDRPGIADGSAVIGPKFFQLEAGFQEEFRRPGQTHEHTLFIPSLLRIGITSRWEARIEGNTFTRRSDLEPTGMTAHVSGLAPLSVGLKYQFQESSGVSHPSLGAIARVFPAWGTGDFRTHHVTGDLRLAADWDFAPKLSLNPNVGAGIYEDDQGKTFAAALFAMTLNYLPTKKLNPFVDVGVQAPEETEGKSVVIVDGGLAYIVCRNIQLDASVGTGAHGNTPPHPFISFGISVRSFDVRHPK